MKKIYKAPTCSYLGKVMTQVFCGSVMGVMDDNQDKFDITFGGKDEKGIDADANMTSWDSFDKGF